MTTTKELNDPEYRWYHKEEMSKIMPYQKERKRLNIKVIDYQKLRRENLSKIKEVKCKSLDWNRLELVIEKSLVCDSKVVKKDRLQPKDFLHFEIRDKCECYLCGTISRYTQLHHIDPNSGVTDKNIVTLCEPCHKMVHLILSASSDNRRKPA